MRLVVSAGVFAAAAVLVFLMGWLTPAPDTLSRIELPVGDMVLSVEVADTLEARTLGLSGRERLEPGTGMLFVFEEPGKHALWMKDMQFPIDILWADRFGKITDMLEVVVPESYPESFAPLHDAWYVLEAPAGFVAEQSIKVGDRIVVPES